MGIRDNTSILVGKLGVKSFTKTIERIIDENIHIKEEMKDLHKCVQIFEAMGFGKDKYFLESLEEMTKSIECAKNLKDSFTSRFHTIEKIMSHIDNME